MRIAFGVVLMGLLLAGPGGSTARGQAAKDAPGKSTTYGGKTLSEWMREINDKDASKRTEALLALMYFGNDAMRAVPLVIGRLQDPDVSPRAKACVILRYLAVDEKDVNDVVKALARRIHPEYESQAIIRYEAARTLRRFSEDSAPAIPYLIIGARDRSSWEIRQVCISILWRATMHSKSGPDPKAVQAMLDSLRSEKTYQVRLEILQGLSMMGKPSDPRLLAQLVNDIALAARTQNKPLAIWAYAGLAALGDSALSAKAMAKITTYLKGENLDVRAQATHALGTLGPAAKSKVPFLLNMLKDKEALAVNGACMALIRIGDTSDAVIDGLLDVLSSPDPQRAVPAVKAIVDLNLNRTRVTAAMDKLREKKDLDIAIRAWIEHGLEELKKPKKPKK